MPGGINMKFQSIVSHLSKIKLDQFQIKQILNMVEKYIVANETAATPAIEYCPKCAKRHSKMIKSGQTKNGKQTQVEDFKISSEKDELHVQIKLNRDDCSCPMCRSKEIKVKGYKIKKVRHSVLAHAPCIIDYKQRRYECKNCV